MKRIIGLFITLSIILSIFHINDVTAQGRGGMWISIDQMIEKLPKQVISESEKLGLIKMREEEKLARDVYKTLYNKWHFFIFDNISRSEQRHMDAIKTLLKKYNISDPVSNDKIGVFKDEKLQNLYEILVKNGEKSLVDALKVGATIEDLDIYDLKKLINGTDNQDIKMVYQNLMKGSRNHLRGFVYQLKLKGDVYKAQYLSQNEVDKILNSPMERGMYDYSGKKILSPPMGGRGKGMGMGMMGGKNY